MRVGTKRLPLSFVSQFDVPGWREKLGDPILADGHLRPHRPRFLHDCDGLQGLHAQTQRDFREVALEPSAHRALPEPEVYRIEVFQEEWLLMVKGKKTKSHPCAWTHGITLPAKPRIQRSCRSSALHYPLVRLKVFVRYHANTSTSMYNLCGGTVYLARQRCSFLAVIVFNFTGRGVLNERNMQEWKKNTKILGLQLTNAIR